jgi:hypothetical protein
MPRAAPEINATLPSSRFILGVLRRFALGYRIGPAGKEE